MSGRSKIPPVLKCGGGGGETRRLVPRCASFDCGLGGPGRKSDRRAASRLRLAPRRSVGASRHQHTDSAGASRHHHSKAFELGAFGGVFDGPAFGFEFVADGVGAFEVFGFAGGLVFFEELLEFWGDVRGRGFGPDVDRVSVPIVIRATSQQVEQGVVRQPYLPGD